MPQRDANLRIAPMPFIVGATMANSSGHSTDNGDHVDRFCGF
jgi:hypothetical protein